MIEWFYYITFDISLLVALILLIRNPIRRFLGAHITYALWLLPIIRLLIPAKFNRPELITKYIHLPQSTDLIPVYTQPTLLNQTVINYLILTWLIGFVIWSTLKVMNWWQFNQYLKTQSVPSDQAVLNQIKLPAHWFKSIELFQLNQQLGPLITGLLKQKIYLPLNFIKNYTLRQQKLMLLHELTHAKRMDLWAQLLVEVLRAFFWFNPLIHLAYRRFHEDQELACDHQILKQADDNFRLEYGMALKKGLSAHLIPQSLTFFHHKHERFLMLQKHRKNKWLTTIGLLFTLIIAYLLLTQSMITTHKKDHAVYGPLVSYQFNEIPLTSIVLLIADSTQTTSITGLELLGNQSISAHAEQVNAFDFLDAVLEKNQFQMVRQAGTWQITQL
ncbi:MAG: M56 family metallopeptidase [Marinicella sp.]